MTAPPDLAFERDMAEIEERIRGLLDLADPRGSM